MEDAARQRINNNNNNHLRQQLRQRRSRALNSLDHARPPISPRDSSARPAGDERADLAGLDSSRAGTALLSWRD